MTTYEIAKHIHMACAGISLFGFILRGIWMMMGSSLLQKKIVKILPHIIDTVLLGSAFYLAYLLHLSPHNSNWIAAKLIALVVYIVLGIIALKRGKTKAIRVGAFFLALMSFLYIVGTARAHDAMWFMNL